jgi:hypothetical protein
MVRRPHLQLLASRGADKIKLSTERIRTRAPAAAGGEDRDAWFARSMGV